MFAGYFRAPTNNQLVSHRVSYLLPELAREADPFTTASNVNYRKCMARTVIRSSVPTPTEPKRKPGRPPEAASAPIKNTALDSAAATKPKPKPGRPIKGVSASSKTASTTPSTTDNAKPGRPPKSSSMMNTAKSPSVGKSAKAVSVRAVSVKAVSVKAGKSAKAVKGDNAVNPGHVTHTGAFANHTSGQVHGIHPLVLGIDVGGSGIKGAPVDLDKGVLVVDRTRYDTPKPSTPAACTEVIAQLVSDFDPMTAAHGPVGVTYPGVVWDGTTLTAANVDQGWIGLDAEAMLEERLKRKVTVLNDAQAAALAEVHYGAGQSVEGMVLMLTFGTGIGSGLVYRGVALPGVELGHLRMQGRDAEQLAAASVKDEKNLSWKAWSERVNDYLSRIEKMLWPELIIIGGGVSEEPEKFLSRLKTRTPVVPAKLGNSAGIVGAAIAASRKI